MFPASCDWLSVSGSDPDNAVHCQTFRAMNCAMAAWVATPDRVAAIAGLERVRELMAEVEARLSRFRPDSELAYVNAHAGQPVRVSPLFWEVLVEALTAAEMSEGLYDPTLLDALEMAGYTVSFEHLSVGTRSGRNPMVRPLWPRRSRQPWRQIELNPIARTVTLPPHTRLDLGGIAKGWAAERAAQHLAALGPCLVDAGGDLAARGTPPPAVAAPGQPGWPIGIADPFHPDRDRALLLLHRGGVATSGVDHRHWYHRGIRQHHLIDPRTGRPAVTDVLTATVIAPTATQADVLASIVVILGARAGLRRLLATSKVEGLLIRKDGRIETTPGLMAYGFRWL
ncbi:MAG: FAD:protein FMN transferase [Caldilineales bacterium]|nr:FAD:protein FMN transferase [Caldilineales bacterium]